MFIFSHSASHYNRGRNGCYFYILSLIFYIKAFGNAPGIELPDMTSQHKSTHLTSSICHFSSFLFLCKPKQAGLMEENNPTLYDIKSSLQTAVMQQDVGAAAVLLTHLLLLKQESQTNQTDRHGRARGHMTMAS